MERRPTIIDVARKAGVSKSTVSLVLRGSPSVKKETRELVRKAMDETGYVYNRSAANLRMSNAGLIGLVINDLRNPFFTEFATSLQMALSAKGYATVIANSDEDAVAQAQVVSAMLEHGVSGLILSPAYGNVAPTLDAIERAAIPAIQVFRMVDDRTDRFPFLVPDYFQGGREATRHLLDQGVRNIAFVGGLEGRSVTHERMAGYLQVMSEAGRDTLILEGRATREFGHKAAGLLMSEYPDVDGVLCFNDLSALGLIAGCHELGRAVGTELKIVGFDDIEEAAQAWPPLSTVRCNIDQFGQDVARTLLEWLEKGTRPKARQRTLTELEIRASSLGPEISESVSAE